MELMQGISQLGTVSDFIQGEMCFCVGGDNSPDAESWIKGVCEERRTLGLGFWACQCEAVENGVHSILKHKSWQDWSSFAGESI